MALEAVGPILMIGDSITDSGRRETADRLGTGWVRAAARALRDRDEQRPVVNRGTSGDRAVDLERRWQRDVLDLRPSLLTVYVGINDTWRRYDAGDTTTAHDFERSYRGMIESVVRECDPRLILMEPFVLPVTAGQQSWHDDLDPKRAVVAGLAAEYGASFVPLQSIFTAAAAESGAASLAPDGVHPSPAGAILIADAWLAA